MTTAADERQGGRRIRAAIDGAAAMNVASVHEGDIVECDVRGRRFFALVDRATHSRAREAGRAL
jgi:hypothetical protein